MDELILTKAEKANLIEKLQQLVKFATPFFELDLSIKLFGVQVFHFHYPPIKKD